MKKEWVERGFQDTEGNEALRWIADNPDASPDDLFKEGAELWAWAATNLKGWPVADKQIAELVQRDPVTVAIFFTDRLTNAQVEEIAQKRPRIAMTWLAARLTEKQVTEVAQQSIALYVYYHPTLGHWLTHKDQGASFKRNDGTVFKKITTLCLTSDLGLQKGDVYGLLVKKFPVLFTKSEAITGTSQT